LEAKIKAASKEMIKNFKGLTLKEVREENVE
jgi:hypothetical protein